MSTIGHNIKKRRLEKRLTLEDLARTVGTSKQTIQRYESGVIGNIPSDKIEAIAEALDVSPAYLMGWEEAKEEPPSTRFRDLGFLPPPSTVRKPRLGVISCGEPINSEENFDGFDDVPESIQCDFTLICEGDSMIGARIHDGDVVYIRQQPTVENGQIAAVLVDGEDKLLKRVYFKKNSVVLQAENPAYEPLIFDREEMNRVSIIGRAVGFTSVL